MTIAPKTITRGFVIAGLMNLSVLFFSRFFTNAVIPETDPDVMSNFGLVMIVLWGLAYIASAKKYHNLKWLIGVFAIEKLIYGCVWLQWITNNAISDVYEKDTMAGLFYSIYGINDLLFFAFFIIVFITLPRKER